MAGERPSRSARVRFRRALTLLVLTLVAPGSAQYIAGHKLVGKVALRIAGVVLALGLIVGVVGLLSPRALLSLLTTEAVLAVLRPALLLLAIGWLALFIDAWRLGRPMGLRRRQRLVMSILTGVMAVVTAGALIMSSQYVASARDALSTVFAGKQKVDPFAGRYNIMLLGTDGGEDRVGLRPDSITIASIDEKTGETALISLPRNLQNVPFAKGSVMAKEFPNGFDCGIDCLLNAIYTWGTDNSEVFPDDVEDPGMNAMRSAVEGITGLPINYHVLVDMQGFTALVDALGGVTIDVRDRLPIGGVGSEIRGYVEPGRQVLDGYNAMWFVRSRADSSDYDRMARQRCLMASMLNQLDPSVLLTKFQSIASAGERLLATDIPASELDEFVDLAWKAKQLPITTVQFVPPLIETYDPDYALIRAKVRAAVEESDQAVDETPKPPAAASEPSDGGGDSSTGEAGADSGSPDSGTSDSGNSGDSGASHADTAADTTETTDTGEPPPEGELDAVCSA